MSAMMRGVLRIGGLGCALLGAASAGAAEVDARGPSECPDAAELGFRVERNLGTELARAPDVKFVVEMGPTAGGYAARLVAVTAGDGSQAENKQRTLTGASCAELADALVVAMTLALGAAEVPAEASPPEALPDATPRRSVEPSAAAPVDSSAAAAPREGEADGLQPSLSVALLADAGSLPASGLGAALGAALSWRRLQLRALGTILFERHTEIGGVATPAPGADLQLFAASLLGCAAAVGTARGAFGVPVCLGMELGWLSGVGTGVASPRSGSAPWAAARVDVGAEWCLSGSPVCFGPALAVLAPITRSRFALTDIGTVYRPPSVTGRLSLNLDIGFD